jgi:succinate dehydrogenase / fumarate reductase, cytochrome b subunit
VQRPISPHLQVYKPQITSVLSIMHRISGISNIVGLILVSLLFIAAPYGRAEFEMVSGVVFSWPGKVVLGLFTLSLSYHLCNGVRHLVWDTGRGLDMQSVRRSAVVVLVVAAILALLVLI